VVTVFCAVAVVVVDDVDELVSGTMPVATGCGADWPSPSARGLAGTLGPDADAASLQTLRMVVPRLAATTMAKTPAKRARGRLLTATGVLPMARSSMTPNSKEVQRHMSRITRCIRLGAIVGLVAAAAPLAAANAATPTGAGVGVTTPAGGAQFDLRVPESLQCLGFTYSLGPFGPLGPWGPYGPLHDKDHPACFGGGPEFK